MKDHLDKAKLLLGIGALVAASYVGHSLLLVASGGAEIQLEGVSFLLPKILLVLAAFAIHFAVPACAALVCMATLTSAAASLLGFARFGVSGGELLLVHLPVFLFYFGVLFLLFRHQRTTANKSLNSTTAAAPPPSDAAKRGAG